MGILKLPIFQDDNQNFMLMQTKWAPILNPLLALPQSSGVLLKSVRLINGTTQVNHLLGRKLQGWQIVRQRAAASIYDAQDANQTPELTLSLVSSALVTVDLFVF